jgi:hypothetical protein
MIHLAPGRLQVVMYTGGHGGEFMCHWLNQHVECHSTDTRILPNNRYILSSVSGNTLKIDSQGSDKTFFYPCHPTNINNELVDSINNGLANLVVLDNNNPQYQGYYLFLFLLKTYYYKFPLYVGRSGTPDNVKNFIDTHRDHVAQQLDRRFYYRHEIESIMNQQPVLSFEQSVSHWMKLSDVAARPPLWGIPKKYKKFHFVDTQELYFGNTETEYHKICRHANIQPTQSCQGITEYVQQNIKLIETYSELGFADFLNLDTKLLKYMLCQMIEKHHTQAWSEEH